MTELRAWERVGKGVDLSVAQAMSFNNVYVRTLHPAELLEGGKPRLSCGTKLISRATSAQRGKVRRAGC